MDEEQVRKMIEASLAPAIKSAFGEFRSYFQEQLEPISTRLSEFEAISQAPTEPQPEKITEGSGKPDAAFEALTARLNQMEKLEAVRQQELRDMKLDSFMGNSVGKYDTVHGDLVKELLSTRYGSKVVEKSGKYYTPTGTTLDEEIDGFFKSEAGSHFLKAPATVPGGTQKSNASSSGTKAEPSAQDMLDNLMW